MSEAQYLGDLRDGVTHVEMWDGTRWTILMPIPLGMSYREAALRICCPEGMTEAEIQAQLARRR